MSSRIPFTIEDERRVLAAIATFPARDRCAIILGINTGFRASELASIKIGQIWDGTQVRQEITVARRDLKNGRGLRRRSVRSRTVPLNAAARAALTEYLHERQIQRGQLGPLEALFRSMRTGRGLSRWRLNAIVHQVAHAAGLSPDGRYGTHTLRKTFCRRVHEVLGRDINLTRQAMGHRYVTTTQAYLEPDPAAVRSAILSIGS